MVHLGVGDERFLQRVYEALAPGGMLVISSICPPQNPPDKPDIP
jgi:cyclopropane fatty-acyl-phospholipid synthase-like methyltransferase